MTGPLVSVREVADAWGVTTRCAKRRLLRLDARLRRVGIALLHQEGEGGPYRVEVSVLASCITRFGLVHVDDSLTVPLRVPAPSKPFSARS